MQDSNLSCCPNILVSITMYFHSEKVYTYFGGNEILGCFGIQILSWNYKVLTAVEYKTTAYIMKPVLNTNKMCCNPVNS